MHLWIEGNQYLETKTFASDVFKWNILPKLQDIIGYSTYKYGNTKEYNEV